MANYKLNQTGEQIQNALNLIDSNTATSGQVLTADGNGSASWQDASGGGGGNQLYLHIISISINSHQGTFYIINDMSTQITSINNCNNGVEGNYESYYGSIVLYKITGGPFDPHTISFKNCIVVQALGFAEDSDGNQTYDCTDTVVAL